MNSSLIIPIWTQLGASLANCLAIFGCALDYIIYELCIVCNLHVYTVYKTIKYLYLMCYN